MAFIKGFYQFWYDFLIGDDWKIAVAVVTTLAVATVVLLTFGPDEKAFTAVVGLALMAAFVVALRIDVAQSERK